MVVILNPGQHQGSLSKTVKTTRENPAVSNAGLELHAPEGDFDDIEADRSTSGKRSDQLFSREQMQFLGTYLKDMVIVDVDVHDTHSNPRSIKTGKGTPGDRNPGPDSTPVIGSTPLSTPGKPIPGYTPGSTPGLIPIPTVYTEVCGRDVPGSTYNTEIQDPGNTLKFMIARPVSTPG